MDEEEQEIDGWEDDAYELDDPWFEEAGILPDGTRFADPGGNSALRAATATNPRVLPCPSCGLPNKLTPADVVRGYQCDACADMAERGF